MTRRSLGYKCLVSGHGTVGITNYGTCQPRMAVTGAVMPR